MGILSSAQVDQLNEIAKYAYGSGWTEGKKGGEGYMGVLNGRTVKFLTHIGERGGNIGKGLLQEEKENINQATRNLRERLFNLVRDINLNPERLSAVCRLLGVDEMGRDLDTTEAKDGIKPLLKRKIVAQVITEITKDAIYEGGKSFDWSVFKDETRRAQTVKNTMLVDTLYPFPDKLDESMITKAQDLAGSTAPQLVEINGCKYILKKEQNLRSLFDRFVVTADHVRNEAVADEIYRAAGVRVPASRIYKMGGQVVKLSQYIENATTLGDWLTTAKEEERKRMRQELLKGYPIDVLLGAWDVLGEDMDNVLVDEQGRPWRVDNGCSFGERAQRGRKDPEDWDERRWPDEWRTMRRQRNNEGVFDHYSARDIFKAAQAYDFSAIIAKIPSAQRPRGWGALQSCGRAMKRMADLCAELERANPQLNDKEVSERLEEAYDRMTGRDTDDDDA